MKTIQHRTTIKTVGGVTLTEKVVHEEPLLVPENQADVLSLIGSKGIDKVVAYITDSMKLERNGEVRTTLFPSNPKEVIRSKVKAYWSETDVAEFVKVMRLGSKASNNLLDEFYNTADAEVKAAIDAIEPE